MSILNVEHLTHGFGDRAIFGDVSFRLLKGEHIGLVGANGEGKSTFLNIVTGKLQPDEGKIEWAKNVRVGYLDQHTVLEKGMTIRDVLNNAFAFLFDIVKGIRNMRATYVIKNAIEISYSIQTKDDNLSALLNDLAPYIYKLCHARCIGYNVETSANVATETIKGGNALIIELGDYVDLEAEKKKMEEELKKLEGKIKRCEGMLNNPRFVSKAPAAKVEEEQRKLADYKLKHATVLEKLNVM